MFEVKDLSVSYHNKTVLNKLSFKVDKSNIVGIIGPNGAGKSTFIKSALDLVEKDSGEVLYNGASLLKILEDIAYLPQRSQIDWDFPIRVIDVVLMGLYPKIGIMKRIKKEHVALAEEQLRRVGMIQFKDRQIGKLSGGQQQRVFMARALIQDPKILFLDEPFVGIDITTEDLLINILKDLKTEGKLVFIVHHDLSKVEEYFDKLLILDRDLVDFGEVNDVFNEVNLSRAYNIDFSQLGGGA